MLDEKQIKQFEENFREIGNESEFLKSQKKEIKSVYDKSDNIAIQKGALSNIFDSVFEEEKLDKSLLEELPDNIEQIDSLDSEKQTDYQILDTTVEETVLTKDAPPIPPVEETVLTEDAEPPVPPVEETIEDNIHDIEQQSEEQEEIDYKETELTLPEKYLQNPVLDTTAQEKTETLLAKKIVSDDDLELEDSTDFLSEVKSLLSDDDVTPDIKYSEQELQQMFASDSTLVKKEDKYRSARIFQKEDMTIFVEKLDSYSIYLQAAIIEVLYSESLEDDSEKLVDLILEQSSPQLVHREVERLLRRVVRFLDDQTIYLEKTLREKLFSFSQQVRKTAQAFVSRILPIAAVLFLVLFYSYFFVFHPIKAWVLYEQGYSYLEKKDTENSEKTFLEATSLWIMPKYYFKYAELYLVNKNFEAQKTKYEQLIFGSNKGIRLVIKQMFENGNLFTPISIENKLYVPYEMINFDKHAFVTIVKIETTVNQDFEKARLYYNVWLNKYGEDIKMQNQLATLYIDWYDTFGDARHLNFAREVYDKIAVVSKKNDESLLLRTRWAIRANDERYFNSVFFGIFNTNKKIEINDETLTTYLEIIQHRVNLHKIEKIADILDSIQEAYPNQIDLPYYFSLYYINTNQSSLVKTKLLNSVHQYEKNPILTNKEQTKHIDSYILLSDYFLKYENNLIATKEYIRKAQILFEKHSQNISSIDSQYLSRLYYIQSKIELLHGNLPLATKFIEKNQYFDLAHPDIEYHTALIDYLNKNWDTASNRFISLMLKHSYTNNTFELNKNQQNMLMLATANSLFFQKNYVAATVYYNNLLKSLDKDANINIVTIDLKNEITITKQQSRIAQIRNNLGASLYYVSKKQLNPDILYTQAFLELQEANTVLQNTNRNEKFIRQVFREIPNINTESLINPRYKLPVNIYSNISYSIDDTKYWQISEDSINPVQNTN